MHPKMHIQLVASWQFARQLTLCPGLLSIVKMLTESTKDMLKGMAFPRTVSCLVQDNTSLPSVTASVKDTC
jgi:hypothetical protein